MLLISFTSQIWLFRIYWIHMYEHQRFGVWVSMCNNTNTSTLQYSSQCIIRCGVCWSKTHTRYNNVYLYETFFLRMYMGFGDYSVSIYRYKEQVKAIYWGKIFPCRSLLSLSKSYMHIYVDMYVWICICIYILYAPSFIRNRPKKDRCHSIDGFESLLLIEQYEKSPRSTSAYGGCRSDIFAIWLRDR